MRRKIIVDTGPIVAFLNKGDRHHEWVVGQFATVGPPLLTCEATLSEACFLLRKHDKGASLVLDLLERELIAIPFRLQDEFGMIKQLLEKYKDVPMSLADACLVRMAEQVSGSTILTLDGDFRIYRMYKRKAIPIIIPDYL